MQFCKQGACDISRLFGSTCVWKHDGKAASMPRNALHRDTAAMKLRDPLDNGKPQPAAAPVAGTICAIEAFKNMCLIRFGYPDTIIGNENLDAVRGLRCADPDVPACFSVLDSVSNQIQDSIRWKSAADQRTAADPFNASEFQKTFAVRLTR